MAICSPEPRGAPPKSLAWRPLWSGVVCMEDGEGLQQLAEARAPGGGKVWKQRPQLNEASGSCSRRQRALPPSFPFILLGYSSRLPSPSADCISVIHSHMHSCLLGGS